MTVEPPRLGQTAVITGAARGIGAAVARRLHADGATVRLIDLDPGVEDLVAELGERAESAVLDVTQPEAWSLVVDGRTTDVLVTCAGILGPQGPVAEIRLDDWNNVLNVNLTGTLVASQAVLPSMLEQGSGYVVYLASIGGKEGNAGQAAYCASKGGVIALTKSVAKEVAQQGIMVNCIAPTIVAGPFADAMEEWQREEILRKIPMRRFGRPQEVAEIVAWLSSPACSFTTGSCFDMSGGRATY